MSPSFGEWLPGGHFALFVLDAVEQLDLSGFYAAYRRDGHGRVAHEPALMVALLLYGYARGLRSSRRIERACVEDVSFRVCGGQPGARSHDDRAVQAASRGGARGPV